MEKLPIEGGICDENFEYFCPLLFDPRMAHCPLIQFVVS